MHVEFREITEVTAQLGRPATNLRRERCDERYAHGKELRAATLANGVGVAAGKLLSLMAHGLNGFADRLHGRGDDLRRMCLDVIEAAQSRFAQLVAIGEGEVQNVC